MNELWAIVKGFENYAVSTKGRVRNLKTGRLLKHQSSRRGGWYAFINLCKKGTRKNVNVHLLVAEAFLGPRPEGMVVHHRDGKRKNPAVINLEYITQAENCRFSNKAPHRTA